MVEHSTNQSYIFIVLWRSSSLKSVTPRKPEQFYKTSLLIQIKLCLNLLKRLQCCVSETSSWSTLYSLHRMDLHSSLTLSACFDHYNFPKDELNERCRNCNPSDDVHLLRSYRDDWVISAIHHPSALNCCQCHINYTQVQVLQCYILGLGFVTILYFYVVFASIYWLDLSHI